MSTITVSLSADRLERLKAVAARFHIAPEDLVRLSIDEILSRPEEDFRTALDRVLDKHSELYKRLG
jgi:hypothetical protein